MRSVEASPTDERPLTGDEIQAFATSVAEDYRVEAEIGSGGWGLVYRAYDLRNDRQVALKVLRVEFAGTQSIDRFRREIEILSRLDHPNIVAFYDSGDFNGAPWSAMSRIAGETLRDRLDRERQLPIGEALCIAKEVADALAYAHTQGIVHRDIKPGNILLQNGRVFVADFGIARAIGRGEREQWLSTSGVQIGTPAYMSPEQGSAESEIDGRSDIYSLGCVLYEMLAGELPFTGTSASAIVARHLLDPVPPLATVRRSVSPSVTAVVYRALAKSPADRFSNASEFAVALDAVSRNPTVSVVAVPRRARRAMIGALAAAAVLVAAWVARTASVRVADARALAAADTTRLVLFPFARDSGVPATLDADQLLRQGLLRWSGVEVVDPFALVEATGARSDGAVSASRARSLALGLHAGRYIRGSLSRDGGSLRAHAMLFDVSRGESPLFEATAMAPDAGASLGAAFAQLADQLLFRPADSAAFTASAVGTSTLSARQAYLRGAGALERWNLDTADSAFAAATRADAHYAQASLWLALSRMWAGKDTATWKYAAQAAAAGRPQLPGSDQAKSDALSALLNGDRPRACALWDALTRREPFAFSAWYGAADCLARDQIVLRDPKSPSGWRFRSGYHSSLSRYRHAFALRPAVLNALRADAFADVRQLLWTSGLDMRRGSSVGPDPQMFAAFPSWEEDTLAFIPFPLSIITSSEPSTLRRLPKTVDAAVQHERRLFRDIATGWVASDPRNAAAAHALAISLFLLGEPSAIDTLARAKALAVDRIDRQRIVTTEIWMRVQFAVPSDLGSLRIARALADSLLAAQPATPVDPATLSSIAALTGRAYEAMRLDHSDPPGFLSPSASRLSGLSRSFTLFASFGGPADSLKALESRTDSLVDALAPTGQRQALRVESLGRAICLAYPDVPLEAVRSFTASDWYLLRADAAAARGDTAEVLRILDGQRAMRQAFRLPELALDALYPEASLLASTGNARQGAEWLDPTLSKLDLSSYLADPVSAAMLVRAMAFRAELAARMGDTQTASRWSAAVVVLWSGSDEFLRPLVMRMRQLSESEKPTGRSGTH